MAMIQYTFLFGIECLHAYFRGGPCRSLTLTPTDDCREMLARYQMIFRPTAAGGAVYCPNQSPPDLLGRFDETAAFTFALISNDPRIGSYTDIDLRHADPRETIFYFDNRAAYSAGAHGNPPPYLLFAPGTPLAQAAVPVRQKMSSLSTSRKGHFTCIEPLGNQVVEQGALGAKRPVHLDLRKLSEGLYLRQVNNKRARRFYLSAQPAVRRWGVVAIYAGGVRQANLLPENCRVIDEDGAIHPKTFTLALEARKAFWRYYIIPANEDQSFDEYEVFATTKRTSVSNTGENDISFNSPEKTNPIDGRAAWVFESKDPLPFLQAPATSFSLSLRPSKNGKSGRRPIRLPYAQPVSLKQEAKAEEAETRLYSEIFVYV